MPDLPMLFTELIRYETELWNGVDARLRADVDLPLSRFEPMQIMAHTPACRVNDIADELAITIGGASKLVDRIEASGHCARRANPCDGRSSIAKAAESFEDELALRLGSATSAALLDQFSATLTKLRAAGRHATANVSKT